MSTAAQLERQIRNLMRERNEADRVERIAREGRLEAKTENWHGKTMTRWYGDSGLAWAPFQPPMRHRVTGFPKAKDGGR